LIAVGEWASALGKTSRSGLTTLSSQMDEEPGSQKQQPG
jgi:hypothetical protein